MGGGWIGGCLGENGWSGPVILDRHQLFLGPSPSRFGRVPRVSSLLDFLRALVPPFHHGMVILHSIRHLHVPAISGGRNFQLCLHCGAAFSVTMQETSHFAHSRHWFSSAMAGEWHAARLPSPFVSCSNVESWVTNGKLAMVRCTRWILSTRCVPKGLMTADEWSSSGYIPTLPVER